MPRSAEGKVPMAEFKIAALGDRDTVLGFRAVGFEVHFCEDAQSAFSKLQRMVKSGDYAVVFVTEPLMKELSAQLMQYRDLTLPAIVAIPQAGGSIGFGVAQVKKSVERAVGADILFKE